MRHFASVTADAMFVALPNAETSESTQLAPLDYALITQTDLGATSDILET
jgi:hypothetical protein